MVDDGLDFRSDENPVHPLRDQIVDSDRRRYLVTKHDIEVQDPGLREGHIDEVGVEYFFGERLSIVNSSWNFVLGGVITQKTRKVVSPYSREYEENPRESGRVAPFQDV